MTRKIQNQLQTFGIHTPDAQTTRMGVSGGVAIYPKHAETIPWTCYTLRTRAFIKEKEHTRGTFVAAPDWTNELEAINNLPSGI